MKKVIVLICSGALLVVGGLYWNLKKPQQRTDGVVVGILQTASHPALDQAREGFKKQLQDVVGGKVTFITQNFEGNMANGLLMAQSLATNPEVVGIFAIATPAAQLMVSTETKKPIFITAVTNPAILTDDGHIPPNLYGTTDMISIDAQVTAIKTLLPKVHKLGIIYNPGEANGSYLHGKMKETFTAAGFTTVSIGVSSEAELGNQVNFACGKVDAIIAPTDNLIISVAGFVADMCTKAGIPFMVSDPPSVANGPLFAAGGVDYARSGAVTGLMAAKVLEGQVLEMPIINALQSKTVVNRKTMKALGLSFDEEMVSF
jgi:putative tryptophan/tyrosine transport system substrate-binding protein